MRSSELLGWWALALVACAHAPVAPKGPELSTLDGAVVDLTSETASHELTAAVFFSTTCPCVARYQRRVEAIAETYGPRGVAVVYVSSNADDEAPALREALRARAVHLPLWVDASGAFAARVGARSTPTVVVLDRSGAVRYRGWLDNEHDVGEPDREPWLARALEALLSNNGGALVTRPTYGCRITAGAPRVCQPPPR